ncbi:MAG TPA: hypothetical protein VMY88_06695 [Acidimicrobiales bacterium]|nr:hypothetical protein [Acidimicrobiales bacterium]
MLLRMSGPAPKNFFTIDRSVAVAALVIAAPASFLTLGTAAMSKFYFERTSSALFEERIGRLLVTPSLFATSAAVVAGLLLLTTVRQSRPLLAWTSAALSVAAIVVSLDATADHRRRLDPRPELTRELELLDLGSDATVVLRTSRPLPDLPEVRWVYRVPLRRAAACERARLALEAWADPGSVNQGTFYVCDLHARRSGSSVTGYATPEGAPMTRAPTSHEEALDPFVHYVVVAISACTGTLPCVPTRQRTTRP